MTKSFAFRPLHDYVVGPGRVLENGLRSPMDVKVGQTVLYGRYTGNTIKEAGFDLIVMREGDLLGVLG